MPVFKSLKDQLFQGKHVAQGDLIELTVEQGIELAHYYEPATAKDAKALKVVNQGEGNAFTETYYALIDTRWKGEHVDAGTAVELTEAEAKEYGLYFSKTLPQKLPTEPSGSESEASVPLQGAEQGKPLTPAEKAKATREAKAKAKAESDFTEHESDEDPTHESLDLDTGETTELDAPYTGEAD